jgi:hypothetical protein
MMALRAIGLAGLMLSASLALASLAMAQEAGGVRMRDKTTIDVHAQDVNTVATGRGNTAITNIGTVDQSGGGHKSVTVDVKNVENVVGGSNRKGCISIGGSPCK